MAIEEIIPTKADVIQFGTTSFRYATIFIIFIVFAFVFAIALFLFLRWWKFNKKIWAVELVGNNWEITKVDRAVELVINRMGDTVFYLRKNKKYLPRPTGQIKRRTYAYYIGEDGEWRNWKFKDMDKQAREMGIQFLHPAIRYARASLKNLWKDNYGKTKFMEKYGVYIIPVIFFAVIAFLLWLVADKLLTIGNQLVTMVGIGDKVMDKANQVLASLDNICSRSGVR